MKKKLKSESILGQYSQCFIKKSTSASSSSVNATSASAYAVNTMNHPQKPTLKRKAARRDSEVPVIVCFEEYKSIFVSQIVYR